MGVSLSLDQPCSRDLAGLIGTIGRPAFEPSLMSLFRDRVGASHLGLFVVNDNNQVKTWSVIDDRNRRETIETTRRFMSRIWSRDAGLFGIGKDVTEDVFVTRRRASDIPDDEYREICYVQPGVVDRLQMTMIQRGMAVFLCAYRRANEAMFSEQDTRMAVGLAPMVLAACERHLSFSNGRTAYADESPVLDESALSNRERQVADLIAAGSTSREIADALGISHHTVLTYRKRIYEKLGVGTQRDLLARRYELALH